MGSQPFRAKISERRTLLFDPSPRSKWRCEAAPVKCASITGSVSMPQSGLDLCVWSRMLQEGCPETWEPREDGKLLVLPSGKAGRQQPPGEVVEDGGGT